MPPAASTTSSTSCARAGQPLGNSPADERHASRPAPARRAHPTAVLTRVVIRRWSRHRTRWAHALAASSDARHPASSFPAEPRAQRPLSHIRPPSDVRTIAPRAARRRLPHRLRRHFPIGDTAITTTLRNGGTRRDNIPNPARERGAPFRAIRDCGRSWLTPSRKLISI